MNKEQLQSFCSMNNAMTQPPSTKTDHEKKINMKRKSLSKRQSDQRLAAKDFLQNKHLGRANKKNKKTGEKILLISETYLLTVWINPTCLDSKLVESKHVDYLRLQ